MRHKRAFITVVLAKKNQLYFAKKGDNDITEDGALGGAELVLLVGRPSCSIIVAFKARHLPLERRNAWPWSMGHLNDSVFQQRAVSIGSTTS